MMVEADLAGKVLLNCQPSKPINFTMWEIMKNVIEAHKKTDKRKNRRGRDSFCSFNRKTFETRLRLGLQLHLHLHLPVGPFGCGNCGRGSLIAFLIARSGGTASKRSL